MRSFDIDDLEDLQDFPVLGGELVTDRTDVMT
jgi:hypothetical protein